MKANGTTKSGENFGKSSREAFTREQVPLKSARTIFLSSTVMCLFGRVFRKERKKERSQSCLKKLSTPVRDSEAEGHPGS
ncbi:Hypothetical predicted protein [Podarcis lilfordi]|uniref:Uncharacterized protein n=1 Tax=Podarcis lilfordi TaxID=74358 RepID=A0AA35KQG1_9SAUR|nr:Hypothetical predicted protein [Podarcis lilfordi]